MIRHVRIHVTGTVQGVGFRPHVYRLAARHRLNGSVCNASDGVHIDVEGPSAEVQDFCFAVVREAPPAAIVEDLRIDDLPCTGVEGFQITRSTTARITLASLPADLSPCADCIAELFDVRARRHGYAFTNCAHCGPRYSIVSSLPYDRERTSLASFVLCDSCRGEFEDPANRRFDAQPIACPRCGPTLQFVALSNVPVPLVGPADATDRSQLDSSQRRELNDARAAVIVERSSREAGGGADRAVSFDLHQPAPQSDFIANPQTHTRDEVVRAAGVVARGGVLALKGVGGFHLLADAGNPVAVARLRQRKHRGAKPLAVMFPSLELLQAHAVLDSNEMQTLLSPSAPIVLTRARIGSTVAAIVAPGNPRIGAMVPSSPLHVVFMHEIARPVVCTSGNLSDEAICTGNREAMERLADVADAWLLHDREVLRPLDDSVAVCDGEETRLLRRARGHVPGALPFAHCDHVIVAFGADKKSCVAVAANGQIVASQHLGDLQHAGSGALIRETTEDLLAFLGVRPDVVACDAHPDYVSAIEAERAAARWGARIVRVQHHRAHIASAALEHTLDDAHLGFAWDGTGLGDDETVWGGEVFEGTVEAYARVAHLAPFRLAGGDAAIREPRRAALGALVALHGDDAARHVPWRLGARDEQLLQILQRGVRSPLTSSMGRLFDAASALCGLDIANDFEGRAAMTFEFVAQGVVERGSYELTITPGDRDVFDGPGLLAQLLRDRERGRGPAVLSARFHGALVDAIVAYASRRARANVVLAGGCFQNHTLRCAAVAALRAKGFVPRVPSVVPMNDGGIAFGQALIAARAVR